MVPPILSTDDERTQQQELERKRSFARERRSQLRGLLLLALAVLIFILFRARPLQLFHSGWWRL